MIHFISFRPKVKRTSTFSSLVSISISHVHHLNHLCSSFELAFLICVHHSSTSFHMILDSGYSYFKIPVSLAMGILNEMILHMNGHASFIIIVILIINLMYCSLLCLDLDLDFCGLWYTNALMNHHRFVCWSFLYTKISSLSSHYLEVIIWS